MMSRMMRTPLEIMSEQVTLTKTGEYKDLKYLIYSAHDTQVVNMVSWLTQKTNGFDYVPYASTVIFELMYSDACVIGKTID